jgi:hypothetical protein
MTITTTVRVGPTPELDALGEGDGHWPRDAVADGERTTTF